jgi:hypothetical protein
LGQTILPTANHLKAVTGHHEPHRQTAMAAAWLQQTNYRNKNGYYNPQMFITQIVVVLLSDH